MARLRQEFMGENPFNLYMNHPASEEATLELRYAVEKFAEQVNEIYSKHYDTGIVDSASIDAQIRYIVWRMWAGNLNRQVGL